MLRTHRAIRPIAYVLLIWYLPACMSYQRTKVAPRQAIEGQESVIVKVAVGADTTTLTIQEPWVRNDSLGGITETDSDWGVPLLSVVELRTRRLNAGKTTLNVLAVAVTVAGVAMIVAWCNSSLDPNC